MNFQIWTLDHFCHGIYYFPVPIEDDQKCTNENFTISSQATILGLSLLIHVTSVGRQKLPQIVLKYSISPLINFVLQAHIKI